MGADIDPDKVKWKLLVPGHYTAKLGCHTEGRGEYDMVGHLSFTLSAWQYLCSIFYTKITQEQVKDFSWCGGKDGKKKEK